MTLLLTRAEMAELTEREHADAQIAWLRREGWPFVVSADGRPKVARAEFDRRMVGGAPPAVRKISKPRLDLVR